MKSAILIGTLALASLLALPPLLTHGSSPDLSDVKLEKVIMPASSLIDTAAAADAPAAAPLDYTIRDFGAPFVFVDVSTIPHAAAESIVLQHPRFRKPDREHRWQLNQKYERTGQKVSDRLSHHQGAGAGGLAC